MFMLGALISMVFLRGRVKACNFFGVFGLDFEAGMKGSNVTFR